MGRSVGLVGVADIVRGVVVLLGADVKAAPGVHELVLLIRSPREHVVADRVHDIVMLSVVCRLLLALDFVVGGA